MKKAVDEAMRKLSTPTAAATKRRYCAFFLKRSGVVSDSRGEQRRHVLVTRIRTPPRYRKAAYRSRAAVASPHRSASPARSDKANIRCVPSRLRRPRAPASRASPRSPRSSGSPRCWPSRTVRGAKIRRRKCRACACRRWSPDAASFRSRRVSRGTVSPTGPRESAIGRHFQARIAHQMTDRIGAEVAAAVHAARRACIALKRVEIPKRDEAVPNLLRLDPHAAAARMERSGLRLKREGERGAVVVTRLRNDRAEQQTDHVGRIGYFERVGRSAGDAVFEPGRAGYRAESVDSPLGGWLGCRPHLSSPIAYESFFHEYSHAAALQWVAVCERAVRIFQPSVRP